jgi:actin-related protein
MNPTKHKKKMVEIFFEKFQVPAVYVAVQGVLSLYSNQHSASPQENPQASSWTQEMESPTSSRSIRVTPSPTAAKEWISPVEMSPLTSKIF